MRCRCVAAVSQPPHGEADWLFGRRTPLRGGLIKKRCRGSALMQDPGPLTKFSRYFERREASHASTSASRQPLRGYPTRHSSGNCSRIWIATRSTSMARRGTPICSRARNEGSDGPYRRLCSAAVVQLQVQPLRAGGSDLFGLLRLPYLLDFGRCCSICCCCWEIRSAFIALCEIAVH